MMLTSEIRRVTVTQADLHYVGSLTIDTDLMEAAGILPGELVHVLDVTNGARLETYAIVGPAGSGVIGVNGAAAHLVHPGDVVTIASYGAMTAAEARTSPPLVVEVDAENRAVPRVSPSSSTAPTREPVRAGPAPSPS